jgi:peroxiredoxin family protein
MTPDEADRLYQAVMLAAPMAALGVVMFLVVWLWPIKRRKREAQDPRP